jgi:hypothetical protein
VAKKVSKQEELYFLELGSQLRLHPSKLSGVDIISFAVSRSFGLLHSVLPSAHTDKDRL